MVLLDTEPQPRETTLVHLDPIKDLSQKRLVEALIAAGQPSAPVHSMTTTIQPKAGTNVANAPGDVLRGWRRELDPDGILEIYYLDFCKCVERLRLEMGNMYETFFIGDGCLKIEALLPAEGAVLHRFRQWMNEAYPGGPEEMFTSFDKTSQGRINLEAFRNGCKVRACPCPTYEMEDVFKCCDVDDVGSITRDDVCFLETDPEKREFAIYKTKMSRKDDHKMNMAMTYVEACKRNIPPSHRLAPRPWQAELFECIPKVECMRRSERHKLLHRKTVEARHIFLQHLRDTYGSEVRAFRRGLDPDGTFMVPLKDLRRFCRRADLSVDVDSLWHAVDKDGDGFLRLEELCVKSADALASFICWAKERGFDSCAAIWDGHDAVVIREQLREQQETAKKCQDVNMRWASNKKMLLSSFIELLKLLGWPGLADAGQRNVLFTALDIYGCGFVARADLEWLDRWDPPEWIIAKPDQAAWEHMRSLMLKRYEHPLFAWRNLLDVDNSNVVSWSEFKDACAKLKFKGNIGGAWRHLDQDLSGAISMKEYDGPSAELLESFKSWADENFGSVKKAFKDMDTDGGGTVSLSELKKECRKRKWQGEVKLLFDCLQGQGGEDRRAIGLKDCLFLDSWEVQSRWSGEDDEQILAQLGYSEKKNSRSRPRSRCSTASARSVSPKAHAGERHRFTSCPDSALNGGRVRTESDFVVAPPLQRPQSQPAPQRQREGTITEAAHWGEAARLQVAVPSASGNSRPGSRAGARRKPPWSRDAVKAKADARLLRAYNCASNPQLGRGTLPPTRDLPWLDKVVGPMPSRAPLRSGL